MYGKIKYTNPIHPDEHDRLFSLTKLVFDNLPEDVEKFLNELKHPGMFIMSILILNTIYTTKRYSFRYKRFVNAGRAGITLNTNRSLLDIGLFANSYNKQFANYDILINAMSELFTRFQIKSLMCSTVVRRVYNIDSSLRLKINRELANHKILDVLKAMLKYVGNTLTPVEKDGFTENVYFSYNVYCSSTVDELGYYFKTEKRNSHVKVTICNAILEKEKTNESKFAVVLE